MAKPLKSILLATNLKDYNKVAFDVAASIATHYEAKLVLLHVLEKIPVQAESLLTGLMGEDQRKKLLASYEEDVRRTLIGKDITSQIVRSSLDEYCQKTGIDPKQCGIVARETVIAEGEVDEAIIRYSKKYDCGMIVIAAHKGLFGKSSISRTIKNVLRESTIPVLTVPNAFE